jgi:hypothetical protein
MNGPGQTVAAAGILNGHVYREEGKIIRRVSDTCLIRIEVFIVSVICVCFALPASEEETQEEMLV